MERNVERNDFEKWGIGAVVDLGCFASINYTHRFKSDILHHLKDVYSKIKPESVNF